MLITKTLFIQTMSAMEFSAKEGWATLSDRMPRLTGRIYLRRIMEASAEMGMITPGEAELWEGAIEIRNTLVHNNGIAEIASVYHFPGVTLTLEPGKMVQGRLDTFTALTEWTTEAFALWCAALPM